MLLWENLVLVRRTTNGSRFFWRVRRAVWWITDSQSNIFITFWYMPYLVIFVMENLFIQVRNDKNIRCLKIFGHEFKLTSFADDVSCLLHDVDSIKDLLQLLKSSYFFNSLKINYAKSDVCGIGSKKGAVGAFSNLSSVDLTTETITILGCNHSYNRLLDIQNVLWLWSMRGLSLLEKIQIFNTLGVSKILYVSSMTQVPKTWLMN